MTASPIDGEWTDPARRAFAEYIIDLACAWFDAAERGAEADAAAESALWKGAYLAPATPPVAPAAEGLQPVALSQFALDVAAERQRQISKEGWTPEHDDQHRRGEMAAAAACYAYPDIIDALGMGRLVWPWDSSWWKPSGERRNLVKAAALLLAEGERLDRATPPVAPAE